MKDRFKEILMRHDSYELFPIKDIPNSLTGDGVRKLLNCAVNNSVAYLELGVFCGATFCAAMYGNNKPAVAVDSWAEEFGITKKFGIRPKDEFWKNTGKYIDVNFQFIESDHWQVKSLPIVPDLYFYDGDHRQEAQEKALTHYAPMLADQFIYLVDDYNWERVQRGTMLGINKAGLRIVDSVALGIGKESDPEGYWNGVGCFLLSKK